MAKQDSSVPEIKALCAKVSKGKTLSFTETIRSTLTLQRLYATQRRTAAEGSKAKGAASKQEATD